MVVGVSSVVLIVFSNLLIYVYDAFVKDEENFITDEMASHTLSASCSCTRVNLTILYSTSLELLP